jgi:oligopeptide transport system substrate-binding protein
VKAASALLLCALVASSFAAPAHCRSGLSRDASRNASHDATTTLHRGNGPEPSTLDAHRCPEVACGNVLRDLYEGLVAEDASGRLIPGMAETWQVSGDGRTWTFRLRDRLRWSNGEALRAEHIVASFRRAFAPATAAPFAVHFDAVENAALVQQGKLAPERLGVAAPDARTVVFRLSRSAALPRLLLLPIAYPVYLPALQAHGAQHTRPGRLVSNGAYRLRAWTPQASLTLERNRFFHAPAPIAHVVFEVTEDAASELQRFQSGGLHITETVPPQPLAQLRARFGAQLRISPYLGSMWLGFNLSQPPLRGNPALREALSLAIDRDKLTRYITGLGETPAYGVVPPGVADYRPASLPWATATQAQRERRARQRYRAAGYSDKQPLEIELRYNTSTPHRRMNLAIAAMWREVLGARVTLRNEEWKVFVGNRKQRVITQAFRGGWIADVNDARNFLANFESGSVTNWSGLQDPAFDGLLHAADQAPTPALRAQRLQLAETHLLRQHAVSPIYFYTSKHLVRPEVRGFAANALDHHPSRFLSVVDGRR